jgi:predicted transposase YdaD
MPVTHDSLFRALIDDPRRAAILIRDFLPAAIAERLTDEPPTLLDGTFVDPDLNPTQSDRLFSVTLRGGGTALLYILIEHKSFPDPMTPIQVLGYRVEIWRRLAKTAPGGKLRLPPIIPLVFYHGGRSWNVPTSVTACLDADEGLRHLPGDMGYILCDLGPIPDAELSSDAEVRAGLLALKHVFRMGDAESLLASVLPGLRAGTTFEEQLIRYMIQMFPAITVNLLTRVARRVKPDREGNLISLAAKEWLRQGRDAGFLEGEEAGIAKGMAKTLLVALETRFGPVPKEVEDRVRASTADDLDGLLRRALTVPSLDQVFPEESRH